MKRIVILMVALFTMSMVFAQNEDFPQPPANGMPPGNGFPPDGGPGGPGGPGGGPGGPGGGPFGPSVAYSNGAALTITSNSNVTNKNLTEGRSDYNVVKDTCATASISHCQLTKTGATSSRGDNSSFFGINAAVYCASKGALTVSDSYVRTNADGANAFFCYNGGQLRLVRDTVVNEAPRSRGIHCTGGNGAAIYAYDCYMVTRKATSSTIATDRGGGKVYVDGGYYEANGEKCAIVYSTGDMTVKNITGYSNNTEQGDIADIEGNNSITLDSCQLTCSGTSRGLMLYQSGSGDATGYSPVMKVSNSTLTLKSNEAVLCEVPTAVNARLKLDHCTINAPSGVLAYVHTNSNWNNTKAKSLLLNLENGKYEGALRHDTSGCIQAVIGSQTVWTGNFNQQNIQPTGTDSVEVNGTWVLDGDSYVGKVIVNKGGKIVTNGHQLKYDALTNNGTLL